MSIQTSFFLSPINSYIIFHHGYIYPYEFHSFLYNSFISHLIFTLLGNGTLSQPSKQSYNNTCHTISKAAFSQLSKPLDIYKLVLTMFLKRSYNVLSPTQRKIQLLVIILYGSSFRIECEKESAFLGIFLSTSPYST